jgi:hypothetical protein
LRSREEDASTKSCGCVVVVVVVVVVVEVEGFMDGTKVRGERVSGRQVRSKLDELVSSLGSGGCVTALALGCSLVRYKDCAS